MEQTAGYTLRRKDIPLIRFVLETEQEVTNGIEQTIYKIHVAEINEKKRHLFPYMLRESLTNRTLRWWIERRKAPKNRQFVNQIMHAIADIRIYEESSDSGCIDTVSRVSYEDYINGSKAVRKAAVSGSLLNVLEPIEVLDESKKAEILAKANIWKDNSKKWR